MRKEAWRDDLVRAVVRKDPAFMRAALGKGLPVNGYMAEAIGERFTPLLYALDQQGGVEVLDVLLNAGADVNLPALDDGQKGIAPLGMAAKRGDLAGVRRLLARGAAVNYATRHGVTALSASASAGKPVFEAVMKALLAAGARPDYQAVRAAARTGSPAMIRRLAAAGGNVNEVSRLGSPLINAVQENRADSVEALLDLGADVNLRLPADSRAYPGKTALEVAGELNAKKLIPLLKAALEGKRPVKRVSEALDNVPTVWKRIAKRLKTHGPGLGKSLNRGTKEDRIAAVEQALNLRLPDDLRQSYLVHDGQKPGSDGLFPAGFSGLESEFVLLPLGEMQSGWEGWKELADAGEFRKRKGQPDAGVRADWCNAKWVGFAWNGGGDFLCVDLAPAAGGKTGQVILVRHDSPGRDRIADGVRELLSQLAAHMDDG